MFLATTNATDDVINNYVLEVLFGTQSPLMVVTKGLHSQMPLYRHMSVIMTENRSVKLLLSVIYIQNMSLYFPLIC